MGKCRALSEEEITRFYAVMGNDLRACRDRLLFRFMECTGMKMADILPVQWRDLLRVGVGEAHDARQDDDDRITDVLAVTRKSRNERQKSRHFALPSTLRREIGEFYRQLPVVPRAEQHVFVADMHNKDARPSRPLTSCHIDRLAKRYFGLAGIKPELDTVPSRTGKLRMLRVSAHSFRVFYIRQQLQQRDSSPEALREVAEIVQCAPVSLDSYI